MCSSTLLSCRIEKSPSPGSCSRTSTGNESSLLIRIPSKAWCLNLMIAAYLSKKTMAPIIGERPPLHVICGRFTLFQRIDYSNPPINILVFGCTCFVQIRSAPPQDKLSPTSHPFSFFLSIPPRLKLPVLMILLHDDSTFLDMSRFSHLPSVASLWSPWYSGLGALIEIPCDGRPYYVPVSPENYGGVSVRQHQNSPIS